MEPFRYHVYVCDQQKPEGVPCCTASGVARHDRGAAPGDRRAGTRKRRPDHHLRLAGAVRAGAEYGGVPGRGVVLGRAGRGRAGDRGLALPARPPREPAGEYRPGGAGDRGLRQPGPPSGLCAGQGRRGRHAGRAGAEHPRVSGEPRNPHGAGAGPVHRHSEAAPPPRRRQPPPGPRRAPPKCCSTRWLRSTWCGRRERCFTTRR